MSNQGPIYFDCNATTPMEPAVAELVLWHMREEYGNAGSRTHGFGSRAKKAVEKARGQVAAVVAARPEEVVFTSGATESNNLAIKGLLDIGLHTGRRHVLSTAIEHKAVLAPLQSLEASGFEVELIPPDRGGAVGAQEVEARLRTDTLLVSVMQANNETGVRQPIEEIASLLEQHEAYLHTDAAQGFGKSLEELRSPRIDLISLSGHKIFGPKGVGALVVRRRGYVSPQLQPLIEGGGQERGLRSGTVPVQLVAGLGLAAELAVDHHAAREERVLALRKQLLGMLSRIGARLVGNQDKCLPHVLCAVIPGVDSEAVIVRLKELVAISNGSACTSQEYSPSHVLTSMGLDEDEVDGALRFSWCHMTQVPDWDAMVQALKVLLPEPGSIASYHGS